MVTVLRIERVRTGLTLREFARRHSLCESTLCRIERGIQRVPPAWRCSLSDALGVTPEAICDDRGWPKLVS